MEYSSLEKLFDQIHQPISEKLVQYNLKESLPLWVKKYNQLKDPSWPLCNAIEDFENLPKLIQQECITIHQFSSEIWRQNIVDDARKKFVLPPSVIQQRIISENANIIANKNVVDFSCYVGGYSFASWKNGAKSVIGFDIRESNLVIANAIKDYFEIPDELVQFVKLDIHNHKGITQLCINKDTVLIPGIMYHVHDHYEILAAVAATGVDNIIIETGENAEIANLSAPLVWWKTEATFENIAGWNKDQLKISVGYPNLAWFNLVFGQLGYDLVSTKQHTINYSMNHKKEFEQIRSVHVYKRV
jgi:hypothetical protein